MATANDFAVEYKKQLDQILSNLGPRENIPPAPVAPLRFPAAPAPAAPGAPAYPEPVRAAPGEDVSVDVDDTAKVVDEIPPEQRSIEDLLQQVDSGDFNVINYLADKEAETGKSVAEILTPEQLQKMQRAARYQYRKGLNPLIIAKKTKDEFLPMLRDTAVALGYDLPASLLGLAWSTANGDTDQFKKNVTEMNAAIETGGANSLNLLRKGVRKVSDEAVGGVEKRDDAELNQRFFTDISMATQLRRIAQGKGEATVEATEDLASRGVEVDPERIGRIGNLADPSFFLPGGVATGALRKLATGSPTAGRLAGVAGTGAALVERGVAKTAGAAVKAPGAVVEGVGKRISAAGTGTGGFATGAGIAGSIATGNLGPLVAGIVAPPVLRTSGDLLQWVGRGIKSKAPLAERATQLVTSTVVRPATEGAALGIIGAIPLMALTDNDDEAAMIGAGSMAFETVRRTGVVNVRRGGQKLGGKMAEITQAGQHLDASFVPYGDPTIDGPAQTVLERMAKSRPSDAALINNFRNALRGILLPDSKGGLQPVEIIPLGDADFAKTAQQFGGKGDEPALVDYNGRNAAGATTTRIYLRESDGAKGVFHETGHVVDKLMRAWGLGNAWDGLVDKTFSGDKQAAAKGLYERLLGRPIADGRAELNAAIFSNILRGNPLDGLPKGFSQKAADMVGYVLERSGLYSPEIRAQKAAQITPARPLPEGFDPMGVQHSFVLDRAGRDLLTALRKGITSEAQVSAAIGQPPVARTGQAIPIPKAPVAPIPKPPTPKAEKGAPPVADLLATTTEAEWQQARRWLEESGASADTLRLFDQLRDAQGKEVEIVYQRITPESRIAETLNRARRETREAGYIKEALGALPEDLREEFFYRLVPYRTVVRWKNGKLNLNPLAFDLGVVFSNALLAVQDVFRINEGLRKTNRPEIVLPIGTEDFKTSTGENIRIISEAGARELRDKLRAYTQNQQHGYAGDGSRSLNIPEGYQERVPTVDPSYTPQVIGADWGNFINMLMGFEPPKTIRAGSPRLNIKGLPIKGTVNEAAQILAAANLRASDRGPQPSVTSKPGAVFPGSGKPITELNSLRAEIERAARDTIDPNYAMRDQLAEATREFNLENIQEFIGTKDTGQKAAVEPFVQAGFMASTDSRPGEIRTNGSTKIEQERPTIPTTRLTYPKAHELAKEYAKENGLPEPVSTGNKLYPEELLKEAADALEDLPHSAQDPDTQEAYHLFSQQILKQAQKIVDHGIDVEPYTGKGEPYANSEAMIRDVVNNKHLYFLKTEKAFGGTSEEQIVAAKFDDNLLLQPSGMTFHGYDASLNDVLRFTHDFFGHTPEGYQFGPNGEFNAFLTHAQMFPPTIQKALISELLMQTSWFFGNRKLRRSDGSLPKRGDKDFVPLEKRTFADPKNVIPSDELTAKIARHVDEVKNKGMVFTARTDAGREAQKRGIEFRDERVRAVGEIPPDARFMAPKNRNQEYVTDPAVRMEDGKIFTGIIHADAAVKAMQEGYEGNSGESGYVTNKGNFLSREKAYDLATKRNQVVERPQGDFVEDYPTTRLESTDLRKPGEGQFMASSDPRAIESAAVRDAEGKIFRGGFHGDAIDLANSEGAKKIPNYSDDSWGVPYEVGFVTNSGEFLSRDAAYARAKEVGQVPKEAEPKPFYNVFEELPSKPHTRDFGLARAVPEKFITLRKLLDDMIEARNADMRADMRGEGRTETRKRYEETTELLEDFRKKNPNIYTDLSLFEESGGVVPESRGQFMAARKPEKRLELTSKMWIEPTGAVVPLGGLGHEQWLSKESTRLNKRYGTKFTKVDDADDRLRALAKGFTRISYETNSGRLAVETTTRAWTKSLRDKIFELAADNIEKIDNMAVNLFNERGELVKQDSAQLFMYDDAEKLDHLPLVTETRSRGAFMPNATGYVGTASPETGEIKALKGALDEVDHAAIVGRNSADGQWRYNSDNKTVYWWDRVPEKEDLQRVAVNEWLKTKKENPRRHVAIVEDDLYRGNAGSRARRMYNKAHGIPNADFMPQTELGLDVPESRRYNRAEIATMNQREKRERFPEAAIPRSSGQKVDYGIIDSPRYKEAETEREAVTSFAGQLTSKYRQHKDTYAAKLGVRWYDDFLPMLKERYGDDAQVFAELLAATSPRNNPSSNYTFAQRAFDKWKAGDYSKIIAKFNEGLNKLSDGRLVKEFFKDTGKEDASDAAQLRWWIDKHDLLPKGDEGQLYGMNSLAVLKVLARRWLEDNRGPKTNQFIRNLTGEDFGATIDMWAARTMREAGYAEYEPRYRILPENETGVTDADFQFSQKVFKEAARRLKLNPAQLQGALWFIEKMNWGDKGWADVDYGSFVTEARKAEVREENVRLGTPTQEALFMAGTRGQLTLTKRTASGPRLKTLDASVTENPKAKNSREKAYRLNWFEKDAETPGHVSISKREAERIVAGDIPDRVWEYLAEGFDAGEIEFVPRKTELPIRPE